MIRYIYIGIEIYFMKIIEVYEKNSILNNYIFILM